MAELNDFAGRRVLVTGGSRGVGRAIAEAFADRGADVAIVYKSSKDAAGEVVSALEKKGVNARAFQADLADPNQALNAVEAAIRKLGDIDILVHSAGAPVTWAPVRDFDPGEWGQFVQNDLIGAFNVIQPVVRRMHERKSGCIVAITSIASQLCQARNSEGAAAKAGLEALIRVIAREEGRSGIRANAVSIGLTDTEQARSALAQWGEEAAQKIISGIPLGRMGCPKEIAKFVTYLASEDGFYFTGKVIQLDGGQVIAG